jgi:ribosomal protein L12E/L44/L45/RPP1/RPP2
MEVITAYMMLTYAQKEIIVESMEKLFAAIDAPVERETLESFMALVKDRPLEEIKSQGIELMSSLAVAAPAAAAAGEPSRAEKEEKKEEEEIEIDLFADF